MARPNSSSSSASPAAHPFILPYSATSNGDTSPPAGKHAHFFRPPSAKAPASTSTSPSFATGGEYFSPHLSANSTRKRVRQGITPNKLCSASVTTTPGDANMISTETMVNERYVLASGLDTPGQLLGDEVRMGGMGGWEDEFGRRGRGEGQVVWCGGGGFPLTGPLARERNGAGRTLTGSFGGGHAQEQPQHQPQQQGWTSFAFSLVGKVFSFSTGVIKGFYSAGGRGYDLNNDHHSDPNSWQDISTDHPGISTPIPGAWQEVDFTGDFEQDSPSSSSQHQHRPPNKRRQTDKDSWVLIGSPDFTSTVTSPKRKSSSQIPRPATSSGFHTTGGSSPKPRPSPPSSTAARTSSGRRSLAPLPRRQTTHFAHTNTTTNPNTSTQPHPTRRASHAPAHHKPSRPSTPTQTHSRQNSAHNPASAQASPLSPETAKHLKRLARQERAADKQMSGLGRQLEDLIRAGREALGTSWDVEADVGGEREGEGMGGMRY